MQTCLLIIGLDPGKTVGYAVLDIDGNLIRLGSEKNIPINKIISKIFVLGDPLIVGTDKKNPPYFVTQFATKLGAKIIHPRNDMGVLEKREMISTSVINNDHELDALASAIYAYKEISPLMKKINYFVRIYGKLDIKDKLIKKVILEDVSIQHAAEILENNPVMLNNGSQAENQVVNVISNQLAHPVSKGGWIFTKPQKFFGRKTFVGEYIPDVEQLRKKISMYKSDIGHTKNYNKKLLKEIGMLKKKLENNDEQFKSELEKKLDTILYFKEQRINSLLKILDQKDEVIYRIKKSIDKLNIMLSDTMSNVIIKKLPNLIYESYELHNKVISIKQGDVLLVDEPNIYSPLTIQAIKDKIITIIHKAPLREDVKRVMPFIFIPAKELEVLEDEFFGIVDRNNFEKILNEQRVLSKVVENYRKFRLVDN